MKPKASSSSTELGKQHPASRGKQLTRPFLRWAGSKQKLLPWLAPLVPDSFDTYFEPFLGAGAMFFHVRADGAVLSDVSDELISTWIAVRDDVEGLIEYLQPLQPDKELFYKIRENRSRDPVTRAAEFLYLNKTCWNGLYRVNSKGKFNVPYGRPRSDFIFDESNLRACSYELNKDGVMIAKCDFEASVSMAKENDFVYFDPPYVNKHNNNGFRDYNENLFSWRDQERLAAQAESLRKRGVKVAVSNANHKDIVDLYPNFAKVEFDRSSTLASTSRFRGKVGEVILSANLEA